MTRGTACGRRRGGSCESRSRSSSTGSFWQPMAPMGEENLLVVIVAYRNTSALADALSRSGARTSRRRRRQRRRPPRSSDSFARGGHVRHVRSATSASRRLSTSRCRERNGRDVLLVNPDARLSAYGIERLLAALRSSIEVYAAVAPGSVSEDGRPSGSNGDFPRRGQSSSRRLRLEGSRPRVTFLIGAVLLLNVLERSTTLGHFDERYLPLCRGV